eukprot:TRINITY_DN324_c0_g1_i1.p1 TRINITY_DN324_c0_g1~~TRINITY_DN324_c0_g1_i1.p1  ORF type:complete len:285 (-),score=83.89 TRINITY_DN324_c0_g1_i1:34-888(-)
MATAQVQVMNTLTNVIGGVPNVVLAVTAGICLIISLNGFRYERFGAVRGLMYIFQILLEFTVIELFFPFPDMGPFVYAACVAAQALILRIYSLLKSKEIHDLMVTQGVLVAGLAKFFYVSIVIESVATIFVFAGFLLVLNVLLTNGQVNVGGIAITGQVLLIFGGLLLFSGYILYLFFLSQLSAANSPRVINRMIVAQVGQLVFVPLLIGLTLGTVQNAFANANIAVGNALVIALIVSFVVNKLLSTTLIGYTFWDICFFTALDAEKEYDFNGLLNEAQFINMT